MVLLIECRSSFDLREFIINAAPIIIGVAALWFSYFQLKHADKQKRNENRRNEIYKKLNDFYGPYIHLRKKSQILYEKFQIRYREKDPNFSTLKYLLKGHKFKKNEKALLEEIIEIGNKSEKLIHENAGLIDTNELRNDLIPRASTHYLLLRLAYKGNLTGDIHNFPASSFPNEIDSKLAERKAELKNQLKKLNE